MELCAPCELWMNPHVEHPSWNTRGEPGGFWMDAGPGKCEERAAADSNRVVLLRVKRRRNAETLPVKPIIRMRRPFAERVTHTR